MAEKNKKTETNKKSGTISSSKKEETKTAYWCDEGGTHHMGGDGANEHGYYNTWNEAYKAFEEYTKDWDSGQHAIKQCQLCGKYYFWAIRN